jgi:D-sedoheptulose 7-phosphate isomerase
MTHPTTAAPVSDGVDDVAVRLEQHVDRTAALLPGLRTEIHRLHRWGALLATRLVDGHRLLVVGNGGSSALGAHLVAELVGRYHVDRPPYSAILLGAESATATALVNDYDPRALFARQVQAHGRPGDVLVALSTSGRSPNVVDACCAARDLGLTTLALTGAAPNPVCAWCEDGLAVPSDDTAAIQELHQIVVHLVCQAFDAELGVAA